MEEVSLHIGGELFKVKKTLLCEYSDYFRAMFSGNYLENSQDTVNINVVDAESMRYIIRYMEIGLIDLTEFSLQIISDLAVAANFLQITELIKQIEYTLDLQLSVENWMEILMIAENASFNKLQQLASSFGLLSFKSIKTGHIPNVARLTWFLSHSNLNAETELQVFEFGFNWICQNDCDADTILIVLGCLDIKRLTIDNFIQMKNLVKTNINSSLAESIIDCLHYLSSKDVELTTSNVTGWKTIICERFTERVFKEVHALVNDRISRHLCVTPIVPMWIMKDSKPDLVPHFLYTYNEESGFEKWLEVADKNLWGWNIASWGPTKLVMVCGERGRGSGLFMKDVRVYDTLRQEWIQHGVELPSRRHGGVAVLGDSLFIVGGVGGFRTASSSVRYFAARHSPMRVVLDTAIVYDLKHRSYRKIAKLPDALQNPAVCCHEDKVYVAGQKYIYRYNENDEQDKWVRVIGTEFRNSCLISHNGYIYCTQNYYPHLYRFKPEVDDKLEMIISFSYPPAAVCNLGNRLLIFTRAICIQRDVLAVEEYTEKNETGQSKVLWSQLETDMVVNDVAGSCTLVLSMPPLSPQISAYAIRYLNRYSNTISY